MWRTGTHILYLLSVEESCRKPSPYRRQKQAHFLTEMKQKRNVFQPASAPPCWEQGTLSVEVEYSGERASERETDREEEGKVNEAARLVREPFHHSLCCETVPLFGSAMPTARRKASCWVLSIGCHSEKIWGNIKWAILHNANSFPQEKLLGSVSEVKPSWEIAPFSLLDINVSTNVVQRLWTELQLHCQTCHLAFQFRPLYFTSIQTWDIIIE